MLRDGKRPIIPDNTNEEYVKLIEDCWQFEPKNRPTFGQIVKRLKKIINKEKKSRQASVSLSFIAEPSA